MRPALASRSSPTIADAALHGLVGQFVRLVSPHSEADIVALLAQFLVVFGNVVGSGPHFMADGVRHSLNLYVCLVGATAKSRKGTAWSQVHRRFLDIAPDWAERCVATGLSSGEGLIWAVRDPIVRAEPVRQGGQIVDYEDVVQDPGVADKRLLVFESEFASVLHMIRRIGNTLSAIIRTAWDSGNLRILTKNAPATATGAHISIVGHITADELRRLLDRTEMGNGFANRILWLHVRRSKLLPEGGAMDTVDFAPLRERLRAALDFAHDHGDVELHRDDGARTLWYELYPELSEGRPGLVGAITSRAEAQVMRLACLYALLDCSAEIGRVHLEAAVALWRYAEDSVGFIFGNTLGDPDADAILAALRSHSDGLTRSEIRDLFGRHRDAAQTERALATLHAQDLVRVETIKTLGRPAERWYAI